MVDNYAPRSILLPDCFKQTPFDCRLETGLFQTLPGRQAGGRIDFREIMLECNAAIDAGLYTFKFGDGSVVKARYTFTYVWNGHKWLITSHHLSKMPEPE